ncbi:unnamed protein product, partial [Larinioides sclopetarius]
MKGGVRLYSDICRSLRFIGRSRSFCVKYVYGNSRLLRKPAGEEIAFD